MNAKLTETELLERIARLPRAIRPQRDPWLDISARLDAAPGPAEAVTSAPGWLARAVAALAVMAVAAGIVFSGPDLRPPTTDGQAVAGPVLIAGSEAVYRAAIREFTNLGEARDTLASGTVETIQNSWSALVRTERALQAALDENPENRFLNQRMLELRSRQLAFLRQLAVIDHSNRRMTI